MKTFWKTREQEIWDEFDLCLKVGRNYPLELVEEMINLVKSDIRHESMIERGLL